MVNAMTKWNRTKLRFSFFYRFSFGSFWKNKKTLRWGVIFWNHKFSNVLCTCTQWQTFCHVVQTRGWFFEV